MHHRHVLGVGRNQLVDPLALDERGTGQLVQRHRRVTEAADPALVPQRLTERITEADGDVLDGVVGVDVDIPDRRDIEVEQGVLGQRGEHVVVEAHPGGDARLTGAVEVHPQLDARLAGRPAYGGDARRALTALEAAAAGMSEGAVVDVKAVESAVQSFVPSYDRDGDAHYDVTSALIKSVRGSDVDAALHYLARMVAAGEDPRFIARRLVILASEDVGLADPTSLPVAMAAMQAVSRAADIGNSP